MSTNAICKIIYPLRYLTYNFCLSILLVKVLLISNAFRVPILTSLEFTSLLNKAQVGIVTASLAPLLSVLFPWLLLDPPFNMRHIYPKRHTLNECKAYSSSVGKSLFLTTCLYIFFQMLLSSFCAFKIRKIPENFSEAKRIAFSMYTFLFSLLCYHPVVVLGWMVCNCCGLCNKSVERVWLPLLSLFAQNVYSVLQAGDKRCEWQQTRSHSVLVQFKLCTRKLCF